MSDNTKTSIFNHEKVSIGDTGVIVNVFWLFTHSDKEQAPQGPGFLQRRKRLAKLGSAELLRHATDAYNRSLPELQKRFLNGLQGLRWDLAIQAPSRAPHAGEYAMLIAQVNNATPVVVIKYDYAVLGEKNSGQSATVEELKAAMALPELPSTVGEVREVLFIDDIFADGKTAEAIVRILRANGLAESAQVSIATVLRTFPSKKGGGL